MNLNNLLEKIAYIEKQKKQFSSFDERNKAFLKALNYFNINFNDKIRYIITGTNGKGSTARFLSNLLISSGYNVGTYTSPYFYHFNERILLNNSNITNDELNYILDIIIDYNKNNNEIFSFFELIPLAAFFYFKYKDVQCIVVEVGIGGKYDITNILDYDYALISSISMDHKDILGNNINDIFDNKIAIVKNNMLLFTTLDSKFFPKIKLHCNNIKANYLTITKKDYKLKDNIIYYNNIRIDTTNYPNYQIKNILLALLAYNKSNIKHSAKSEQELAILKTYLPGRFEIIDNIVFDGAHNVDALTKLKSEIKKRFKNKKIYILFSILTGKEYNKNIKILKSITKKLYYYILNDPRLISPTQFKDYLKLNLINFDTLPSLLDNIDNDSILIVTGSIHLLSQIKMHYEEYKKNKINAKKA